MNILLLKGYNNYFNRILKREDTIANYKNAVVSGNLLNYYEMTSVNFNTNDGITTSITVGKGDLVWDHPESEEREGACAPDYCVAYNSNGIHSRWFVLEVERTRDGQYKVALKRDVLADYYENVMTSPCFIEKGMINDVDSPLLLNSEGMRFNQIKNSEDFIKDNSKCAWLVGYLKKNITNDDLTHINPINYTAPSASSDIPSAEDYDWEECIQYVDVDGVGVNNSPKKCFYFYNTDISFRTWYAPSYFSFVNGNVRTKFTENFQMLMNSSEWANSDWGKLNSTAFDIPSSYKVNDSEASSIASKIFTTTRDDEDVRNKFETMIAYGKQTQFSADTILINEDIFKYNGKQVVKDGHVYRLEINPGQSQTITQYQTGNDSVAVSWMTSVANKVQHCNYNTNNASNRKIQLDYRGKSFEIVAREVVLDQTLSFNFPVSATRNNCIDATYDMFAMPIDPKVLGLSVSSEDVVVLYGDASDGELMNLSSISEMQLIMSTILSTKLGAASGGALNYDLQLLPYCPFDELNIYFENQYYGPTYGKTVIDVNDLTSMDYTLIYNNETTPKAMGIILYPKKANFSKLVDFIVPNETVHEEWLTIENPTFTYNNMLQDGLPLWVFHDFPYEVEYDSPWDIGPNQNNPNSDVLTDFDVSIESIGMYISGGLRKPFVSITSDELPLSPTSSQKITIEGTISVRAKWIMPDRPIDIKIKNECDMYRLSSPNFMSMYEFKKTKLRNGILSFNIDCTYKPFTPYIKLNPNYDDSLYATQDFNDSMGLILSGDFSIPMLSDAWINYELQNRNYQAVFNRQIQNLDVNMQIAKEQQQFQAVVGTLTGSIGAGAGGAMAGFKMGGPYGAIAGAAIGATTGLATGIAGGVMDAQWLARQQQEARSFAVDNFNYQLGNTQALNPTITKSTPLTYNNKVWPILEYYTCTNKEKELLEQKIKYDGMTIMAIDTLRAYASNDGKLKGKLIRLEGLKDDSHVADAIYQEVDKGFYIKGE